MKPQVRVFAGEAFASQHDAETSIFSFCKRGLKKATLTEDARNKHKQIFGYLRRTLVQLTFEQKRFCLLRLPLVVAMRREMQ